MAKIVKDDMVFLLVWQENAGPGGLFLHGMTYSGHPAAAAAGLANIALMERDKLPEQVRTTGKIFESTLRGLDDLSIVGEVRGSHFMVGIEFVKDKATKEGFDPAVGERIFKKCVQRGVIVRPVGNRLVISPPLIITPEQCDEIVDALKGAIEEFAAEIA